MAEPVRYRLTYDSGAGETVWEKTLGELLVPNGDEPLLVWMLRESEAQGRGIFVLERLWTAEQAVEAEIAAYERDRCVCGGSPSWWPEESQVHRADCEVRNG